MLIRLLIVSAFLLLGGCVAGPTIYDSDPGEFSSVPESHGVVVFQGVVLDPRLNQYMYGWDAVRMSRLGGPPMTWLEKDETVPAKYHVYPDYEAIPGTTLWVGVLPAGNYLIEDFFASFNNGQYYGHLAVPVSDKYASFTIEPGKTTVLDAYVYKSFGDKHMLGSIATPDALVDYAREVHPDIMSAVDSNDVRGFDSDERDGEVSDTMMKWARTLGDAEYGPDGAVYRGSRGGQIFERLPNGEWRRTSLPTLQPVESIEAFDDGSIIAISQGGHAWRRGRRDAEFERLPFSFNGELQTLSRTPDEWVAAVRRTIEYTEMIGNRPQEKVRYELDILRAPSLEGRWEMFQTLPVEKAYAGATLAGDNLLVGNPGALGRGYPLSSGQPFDLPDGFAFLRDYEDGTVLGYTTYETGFWGNDPAEIWISRDHGRHWEQLSDRIEPKGMAEYLGNGEVLVPGRRTNRTRQEINSGREAFEGLLKATTGSRSWESVEEVPEDCVGWAEVRELADGRLLLCEYSVFRRHQGSAEWIEEDMRGFDEDETSASADD